ncbi:MAG: hypothetical protein M3O28_08400 [Actinomycetota bacterium]|nr:hypothetical protein [Actinomycetota bacterium]
MKPAAVAIAAALTAAVLTLSAGCTGKTPPQPDTTLTQTLTTTRTTTPAPPVPAAATVAPLPPGQAPAKGEVERSCPYIASTPDENPNVNVADIEGDHVYRTTVLTAMSPVGCRFYFYSGPFEAIADILTYRYATTLLAHNALVRVAAAGSNATGVPSLVAGVEGIQFQTKFYGPDGAADWACAFAKGTLLVVVHTQQNNNSSSAKYLAQAVAPKF